MPETRDLRGATDGSTSSSAGAPVPFPVRSKLGVAKPDGPCRLAGSTLVRSSLRRACSCDRRSSRVDRWGLIRSSPLPHRSLAHGAMRPMAKNFVSDSIRALARSAHRYDCHYRCATLGLEKSRPQTPRYPLRFAHHAVIRPVFWPWETGWQHLGVRGTGTENDARSFCKKIPGHGGSRWLAGP